MKIQHTNLKKSNGKSNKFKKRIMVHWEDPRNQVEREVGGGIGMGNTCKSMADSCRCMTKTTTIL